MSSTQNLAPIMPFIEPTDPIELPSVFELQTSSTGLCPSNQTSRPSDLESTHQNSSPPKGKAVDPPSQRSQEAEKHRRTASEEEAMIERTRMELERKIGELNKLKNQLAQTEQRERELASRIVA